LPEQQPYAELNAGLSQLALKLADPPYLHLYSVAFKLGDDVGSIRYSPRGEQLFVTVPRDFYKGIDQRIQVLLGVKKSWSYPQWDSANNHPGKISDFMMLAYCGITPEQIMTLCTSDEEGVEPDKHHDLAA